MPKYDTASRHFFQHYTRDFIRLGFPHAVVEIGDPLDTAHTIVEDRQTDSLIRVRIDGQDAILHYEFQTADSTDPPMPLRMASYIGRLVERYRLPVYSTVIYLRRTAGRRDPGRYIQRTIPGHQVAIKYRVIRLSELDGQAMLAEGGPGLLPFVLLMGRPPGVDEEEWLRQCIQAAVAEADEAKKVDVLGGMTILSGLEYDPAIVHSILSKEGLMHAVIREGLMDLIMRHPLFAESFAESLVQSVLEQSVEQGVEQSVEQGVEQVIKQVVKQGVEQGERKQAIASLCEVVELRFGADAVASMGTPIAAINDVQRLNKLLRTAIQASSFEEFRRLFEAEIGIKVN